MIIDSITHVTPDGRWFNTAHDASETRLLREIEQAKIDRAVVVALAGFISNEFVLDICHRHPDLLVPGASFDPSGYFNGREAAREFRSQLHGQPYRVLKLHPRLNRYDPLDPRCLAVLDELASWQDPWPVWIDTLFYTCGLTLRRSVVDTIHEIVGRFPTLQFVLLHAGGSYALQVAEALRDCPNTLLDMSFTMYRYVGSSLELDFRYLLQTYPADGLDYLAKDMPTAATCSHLNQVHTLLINHALTMKGSVLNP